MNSLLKYCLVMISLLLGSYAYCEIQGPTSFEFQGPDLITDKQLNIQVRQKNYKATIVFFLSTQCPCSKSHFEHLISLANKYKNFRFIGIHSNKRVPKEQAQHTFKNLSPPFPIIQDEKSNLANMFMAIKTPHVFVVSQEGKYLYHGGITNRSTFKLANKFYLASALEKIQKGLVPSPTQGRALGCSIVR